MNANITTLDVREDIRQGREPFSKIMRTVAELGEQEEFLLIAPFEPVPLYAVLARQGFGHRAKQKASGDWEVVFTRESRAGVPPALKSAVVELQQEARRDACTTLVEIDARGLEPPQPLIKILEAVEALPEGAEMRARTNRRPVHLYPHLEDRGFAAKTEEQSDGSFITYIQRA
jgi:uncharacterized protein (DUF2249 family)